MMNKHMRIAVIDDSKVDRAAFVHKMRSADSPWLRDVDIVSFDHPFTDLEEYRKFDVVILDQEMQGVKGTDVAQQIHAFDWHIPVVLVTGMNPNALPHDVRDYTWGLAFKHGASLHHTDGEFGVLRSVLRTVAAVRDAYDRGVKDALNSPLPDVSPLPDTPV